MLKLPDNFSALATRCLPQSFDCEDIYVNHDGHLALRRGPRGMAPHILKTNVIAVQKLVGLLTSTKSYSLSKKAKEGEKPMKQAGYLETSRVVNAGAQGVPYERLKFATSEMVARAQLVLAMGGQLEPALKRGATFILENALASDEVDALQVSRAVEAMSMDILGVSLEQTNVGPSDESRSSCSTRDLLNEYHVAHLISKCANCSLPMVPFDFLFWTDVVIDFWHQ